VDANCSASCNAGASAKAECAPPTLEIKFDAKGNAEVEAKLGKLKATLLANLGVFGTANVKLKAMGDIGGTLAGNLKGMLDIKPACIPTVVAAMTGAVQNVAASVEVTGKIVASVK